MEPKDKVAPPWHPGMGCPARHSRPCNRERNARHDLGVVRGKRHRSAFPSKFASVSEFRASGSDALYGMRSARVSSASDFDSIGRPGTTRVRLVAAWGALYAR